LSATPLLPAPSGITTGEAQITGSAGNGAVKRAAMAKRRARQQARPQLASLGRTNWLARAGAFVLGTIWLCIVLFPIYYMLLTSFRSQSQYLTANAWLPEDGLSLSSWSTIFSGGTGLWGDFLHSIIFAAGTIILVATLSLVAAFRIVQRGSRFSAVSFRLILFGLAVPIQAIIIPIYVITLKLHIYDSLFGLILVTSASLIAVAVLLTVNYVRMIPNELYDAMAVDGAKERTIFSRLVWPLARPVVGVVSIFAGLGAWNNFLLPLILTQSNSDTVLPLGLFKVSSTASGYGVNVPVVMAGVVFSVLPLFFLYLALRRQFVRGIGGFALR
jgi:ABC-type glycerol-3-phosphate transport system permease component